MHSYAVIGLGRFGSRMAMNLAASGQDVIAIDLRRHLIDEISDKVTMAVALDATDEAALRAQSIDQVDTAIVGIGADFEAAALTTVTLKHIGVKRVVSRAMTRRGGRILERIGADQVIHPEDEAADRWTLRLTSPTLLGHHELAEGYSIAEVKVLESWLGKTLQDLNLRSESGLLAVAIKQQTSAGPGRRARSVLRIPRPDRPLESEDILVLIGADKDLARLPSS